MFNQGVSLKFDLSLGCQQFCNLVVYWFGLLVGGVDQGEGVLFVVVDYDCVWEDVYVEGVSCCIVGVVYDGQVQWCCGQVVLDGGFGFVEIYCYDGQCVGLFCGQLLQ